MTETSPFLAGLLGRCPRCGKGALFQSYLKVADACGVCGLDFSSEDSGDGPAVFVMSIVGFIVVPAALAMELAISPPVWVHMLVWLPLATLLTLLILPPFKATLFALQWKHNAHEAQLDLDPVETERVGEGTDPSRTDTDAA
ncbi:MAG: DUF983 domain-containing protein [Oceanicaulis sp.]|uniref:DUF983 domain-containing protein n=1 Tax=Oceanicaulis TaxID=153232 RepID=UPI0003B3BC86|nr:MULTISPECIES: DUF983 domain-containing protein [Oceanicaulis]MAP49393.1 DUF983 domain-containing protein [Oceanicaulis sp.]VXC68092.1 conserved hypothetical protein [Oceanicaulis sp. 350]|tara:strand:+ start:2767 stop:3192 length:426 start_codon:yes stop_codon:yes gene_type:complete